MQFVANRKKLDQAISNVIKVMNSKSPVRSLEGIKITLTHDEVELRSSDGNVTIVIKIPAVENGETNLVIQEPGEILISNKFLSEIVRKLEDEQITLESVDENLIKIKDSRAEFTLHTMVLEEYPNINIESIGESITIESSLLKEIIRQTIFAVSDKDTRPILMGVNFKAGNNILDCTASDTYRLSRKTVMIKEPCSFDTIIPSKTLNIITNVIDDSADVLMTVSATNVTFIQNHLVLSSKVINGPFPDVSKLISKEFEHMFSVKGSVFASAIERASLLSNRNSPVKLSLSQNSIEIYSTNQEVGYVKEKIDGIYVDQPFVISFNSVFMIEAIKAISKDDIVIYFAGEMRPFIIRGEKEESLVQIILPVRRP